MVSIGIKEPLNFISTFLWITNKQKALIVTDWYTVYDDRKVWNGSLLLSLVFISFHLIYAFFHTMAIKVRINAKTSISFLWLCLKTIESYVHTSLQTNYFCSHMPGSSHILVTLILVFRHLGCVIDCTIFFVCKARWARRNEK